MPDSHHYDFEDADDPGGGPWRAGLLSLLALGLVIGGVLLFGGAGDDDAPPTATGSAGITIPPLPEVARQDGLAPDFSLELFDGTQFTLSRHLQDDGRPVILNLWASWCPPCRDEMPDLDAAAAAHPEVLILGVAVNDDVTAAADFAAEIGITYAAGYDETGRVDRSYPSASIPATFVIASDGTLVKTVFGRLTEADIDDLVVTALGG